MAPSTNQAEVTEPSFDDYPEKLRVSVNGATFKLPKLKSKAGNAWYHGAQEATLTDPSKAEEALGRMVVECDGQKLNAGEVRKSLGRKLANGTRSGGGNLTVLHNGTTEICGRSYQLQAQATVKQRKRGATTVAVVVVHVKAIPPSPGRTFEPLGEVEGELSF